MTPDPQQLTLPAVPDEVFFQPTENMGIYTGTRLQAADPGTYARIIDLSLQGQSIRSISRLTGLHRQTIGAVLRAEAQRIVPRKEALADHCRRLLGLTFEELEESLVMAPKHQLRDLSILAGILVERYQLLSGGATARVEHVSESAEVGREFLTFLQRLQMGIGGEKKRQKAETAEDQDNAVESGSEVRKVVQDAEYKMVAPAAESAAGEQPTVESGSGVGAVVGSSSVPDVGNSVCIMRRDTQTPQEAPGDAEVAGGPGVPAPSSLPEFSEGAQRTPAAEGQDGQVAEPTLPYEQGGGGDRASRARVQNHISLQEDRISDKGESL